MTLQRDAGPESVSGGKKHVFTLVPVLIPMLFVVAAAELYVHITRPHVDLWLATGRRLGVNPMAEWALIDALEMDFAMAPSVMRR